MVDVEFKLVPPWQSGLVGVMPGLVGEPTAGLVGLAMGDWCLE